MVWCRSINNPMILSEFYQNSLCFLMDLLSIASGLFRNPCAFVEIFLRMPYGVSEDSAGFLKDLLKMGETCNVAWSSYSDHVDEGAALSSR